MPVGQYDKYFGGKRGDAQRTLASMKRTYGAKKGETVFYATIHKRERKRRVKGR